MKKKLPKKLSSKLSTALLQALEDLRQIEKSPKYVVKMAVYHTPNLHRKICFVCLAGAVMARRFNIPATSHVTPGSLCFRSETGDMLEALNQLRQGFVGSAFQEIGLPASEGNKFNREIAEYSNRAFKSDLTKLAKDLSKAGY